MLYHDKIQVTNVNNQSSISWYGDLPGYRTKSDGERCKATMEPPQSWLWHCAKPANWVTVVEVGILPHCGENRYHGWSLFG